MHHSDSGIVQVKGRKIQRKQHSSYLRDSVEVVGLETFHDFVCYRVIFNRKSLSLLRDFRGQEITEVEIEV